MNIKYSAESLWEQILQNLQTSVSSLTYESWFVKMQPLCFKDDRLVLICHSNTAKRIIPNNYMRYLEHAVQAVRGGDIIDGFTFITQDEIDQYVDALPEDALGVSEPISYNFNKDYTFDEFIVSESNNFVVAACKSVASNPGSLYNPLFIYGNVGLGKTHLMHAIGQEILRLDPKKRVLYVTSADFTHELVNSMLSNSPSEKKFIRNKYRSCDVLMIDDIQFLAEKKATQDELFNIFNELYNSKKQIVLSSDRPLSETKNIEDRLVSRFGWGLMADIQSPSPEAKIAILRKKAFRYHFKIDDNVYDYMASLKTESVRDLEGMLKTVTFYLQLNKDRLEHSTQLSLAKECLKDYGVANEEQMDIESIIDYVSNYFNIDRELLVGRKRNKEIVVPRQIAIYVVTKLLPTIPLKTIGESFSGIDHTSVMHSRDKIDSLMTTDLSIEKPVVDILNSLKQKYTHVGE